MPLPRIIFEGRLVDDPSLRFTNTGKPVANLTIASNDRVKGNDGNWTDGPGCFIRCTAWDRMAEQVAESLTKGTLVHAEGRLAQREYEKDGERRTVYEATLFWIAPSLRWNSWKMMESQRTESQGTSADQDPWGDGGSDAPF